MATVLRRAALLLACGSAITTWGLAQGRAQVATGLSSVLEVVADLDPAAQRVVVNGLVFEVSSGFAPGAPSGVLDALERDCAARDAGLEESLSALWPGGPSPTVFRLDAGEVGMVACLELGAATWDLDTLSERLEEAAARGDLAELGAVRIARVQPAGEGAHWVSVVSRGGLPLMRAFPPEGDAPGLDLPGLPRPRGARRLLSAFAEGRRSAIVSYGLPSRRSFADWRRTLRAQGWALQAYVEGPEGPSGWQATRRAARLLLFVDADGTTVTVIRPEA